jgi:carbon-monoxide dehydrogenase iron sulfur subunit
MEDSELKRVYINEDVCMGCGLCRVYCQTEHSRSKDIIRAFKKELPPPVPRVRVERNGEVCFSLQCRHCDEPWCVYSCLTGAMHRDPVSGMVVMDREKCMGCWTCIVACPSGALTRDVYNHVVAKCDLCPDREVPACVANCPNEALVVEEGEPRLLQVAGVSAGGK